MTPSFPRRDNDMLWGGMVIAVPTSYWLGVLPFILDNLALNFLRFLSADSFFNPYVALISRFNASLGILRNLLICLFSELSFTDEIIMFFNSSHPFLSAF